MDQRLGGNFGIVVDVNGQGEVWLGMPGDGGLTEVEHDCGSRYDRSLTNGSYEPSPVVRYMIHVVLLRGLRDEGDIEARGLVPPGKAAHNHIISRSSRKVVNYSGTYGGN